jgi:hypothetical protein
MSVTYVKVRRSGTRWGVTETGLGWVLAEFSQWEDALDYARTLAVSREQSILEGEDDSGRLTFRQSFSADADGVVRVSTQDF